MKTKTYIKPDIEVMSMGIQPILAASNLDVASDDDYREDNLRQFLEDEDKMMGD